MSLSTNYLKSKDKILATIIDGSVDEDIFIINNTKESKNSKKQSDNQRKEIAIKVYEALLSSIISQQISVMAANSIKAKIKALYGGDFPNVDVLILENIESLRLAGLSLQKAQYMKNVAEYFSVVVDLDFINMSDEEIINTLTQIKGVGRWTVEMMLMFTLGRKDVFAIKDGGLISGVTKLYNLEKYSLNSSKKIKYLANKDSKENKDNTEIMKAKDFEKKILEITSKWSPYRSIASLYLWKYKDSQKKL